MPIYNVEKYIRNAIDSVLSQTYEDFELILVDDGSPDNCPNICDEYVKRDSRVCVIHKKNGGLSSARNAGLDIASGKYVLFIDSDDTIEKTLLSDIVPLAEGNNAEVVVFGIYTRVIQDGKMVSKKDGRHKKKKILGHADAELEFEWLTQNGMWNYPVDKLYKRRTIEDNQIRYDSYYDRVCEDTIFLLDLFPYVNNIVITDGCYYNYFIRSNQSVVTSFQPDRYEKCYQRFLKTIELLNSFSIEVDYRQLIYFQYCDFILWTYEYLFNDGCDYSLWERYKYMRDTYSIRKESMSFCNSALEYFSTQDRYIKASGSTKKVLKNILKKHYSIAWLYHAIAYLRYKIKR